jgi:ABC-type Fe3+-hydroxamate transport system substrate-binding protein
MDYQTDQLGRKVQINRFPKRIVSVVPSQTELLADLGLEEQVSGITGFCRHPDRWYRSKARVGGTKQLRLDNIRTLSPDLILANKEENDREQLETLMQEFPVWVSDIHTLSDAEEMIRSVGRITGTDAKAEALAQEIGRRFHSWSDKHPVQERPLRVAYLIWKDPWMAAGKETFIHAMLGACGLQNCLAAHSRYPVIDPVDLTPERCDLALLSSEPFPFKEKHAAELRRLTGGIRTHFVDGEAFSWYGSRLLKTPAYFSRLWQEITG